MLHILLLILKIAGVILAVILGILLLVLCIILFVPFCYQGAAKWDAGKKDFKAQGRVTWLLGLLEIRFAFKDGRSSVRGRIAWKKLGSFRTDSQEEEPALSRAPEPEKSTDEVRPQKEEEHGEEHEEKHEKDPQKTETIEEAPAASAPAEKTTETSREALEETYARSKETRAGDEEEHHKIREALEKICRRLQQVIQKIKCTFRKICDKIDLFMEKKEQASDFLSDEIHKKAFYITKKEVIRLLVHVLPRHFKLSLRFGFEDPYHTGQLLAGIAVFYPFLPGEVRISPDFEERIFQGAAKLEGRLYTASLVFAVFQLIRRRAVRETFRDIRGLRHAEA